VSAPLGITDVEIAKALILKQGIMSHAAELLGVTRGAITKRVNANPDLKKVVDDLAEVMLDTAESVVYASVRDGDARLAMDYLKQKGRARGFGNKTELTGADGGAIQVAGEMKVTVEYIQPANPDDPEVVL
jgi:hypothetical protein